MSSKGVVVFAEAPHESCCAFGSSDVPGLEPVANRPIAYHVLDALLAAGVDELILVGTTDVLIDVRSCLNRYRPKPGRLDYAVCADRFDAVAALRAAAPLVGAAPCIVHLADGLLDEPLTPYLDAVQKGSFDLILLCEGTTSAASHPQTRHGASNGARRSAANRVTPVNGFLRDAGIGIFGPGALREACQADARGPASGIEALARDLGDDGKQVQVRLAEGWRRYRGNPSNLLEVNRLALDLLAHSLPPTTGHENRIEGRVQIDATASVTTSVIVGPVVVGEGAQVANAYIGPYTSIGAQARVEGVEIERSIISPGASVMHVGGRLVSSLVGRGAHVFRDFSLPRAMRLRVGAGDEVALC